MRIVGMVPRGPLVVDLSIKHWLVEIVWIENENIGACAHSRDCTAVCCQNMVHWITQHSTIFHDQLIFHDRTTFHNRAIFHDRMSFQHRSIFHHRSIFQDRMIFHNLDDLGAVEQKSKKLGVGKMSVVSCQLFAVSCQLFAVSCQLLCQLLCQLSVVLSVCFFLQKCERKARVQCVRTILTSDNSNFLMCFSLFVLQ